MKIRLLLILGLSLALTACAEQENLQREETTHPQAETTVQATLAPETAVREIPVTEEAVPETSYPDRMDLNMTIEGMPEAVPALRWDGDGYLIYIPEEGWQAETEMEDGFQEDSWENIYNEDVELSVLHLGSMDPAQAEGHIRGEYDDCEFRTLEDGSLLGSSDGDGDLVQVWFRTEGERTYALIAEYTLEAAEGFGCRMGYMVDSFRITE